MRKLLLLGVLCSAVLVSGAELFVGPGRKYTTVKAGIAALKEGDTLTIAPGRYYETIDVKKGLKNVKIRAQYPGSVLIHGDKPAPRFVRVPGYRFVYAAEWPDNVTAVNERDTFRIYFPAPDVRFLEFNFGYWFKKDGKLYISTTDGGEPKSHTITVSVLDGNGLRIAQPENVTVEGLSFTGFYSHFRTDAWSGRNGIQLQGAKKSTIRNCRAFFNANGITLSGGEDSVIEGCVSFANGSQSPSSGGNIIGWSGKRNEIRNNLSMYKIYTGGSQGPIGIRFYGIMEKCKMLNNRSFGEDGINIKGSHGGSFARGNYSERHINVLNSFDNLFTHTNGYNPKDKSKLMGIKKSEWSKHFADPENHDFRPLKEVHIELPEKITSGMSVILPPRDYIPLEFEADNVSVSTRGNGKRAIITGGRIEGKNIKLDNLEISEPLQIKGENITLTNCVVKAKLTVKAKEVQLSHCHFEVVPDCTGSTGFSHSNTGVAGAIAPLHFLEDVSGFDGFAQGPVRIACNPGETQVFGPFVYAVSDTSADIEWWTSSYNVSSELRYGTTPKCEKRIGQPFSGGNWHSVTITGLKPGTKYYFKVNSRSPLRTHHSSAELAELDRRMKRRNITTTASTFTTAVKKAAPRVLKVTGRVISPVLDQARSGDTVMIKGGVYSETLYIRSAGVTLRNVPGEKVIIDGKRVLETGIIVENKPGTLIDGLFFKDIVGGNGAGVVINGGKDITVRRCFYDGRTHGYTPVFVKGNNTEDLTVENCVILRGFHGAEFYRCPGLVVRNNVWSNNQINHFYVHNLADQKVLFTKNIMLDNIPGKIGNNLINVWQFESFKEKENCYYLRAPKDKRTLIAYRWKNGKPVDAKPMPYVEVVKSGIAAGDSIFLNPGLKAVPRILQFKKFPFTPEEKAELGKAFGAVECGLDKKQHYAPWDFSYFMSSNPICKKKKIGLDPALFTNGAAN